MIRGNLSASFSSYMLPSQDTISHSNSTISRKKSPSHSSMLCENRTQTLILDYKRFLAARCIQKFVRGWLERRRHLKKVGAARVAQRAWRNRRTERQYITLVENQLQNELSTHFDGCATKIQSYFRGWRVRQYLCDVSALHFEQTRAMTEFLKSLAIDLHRLKLQGFIPGLLSVQNLESLRKVEVIINALSIRFMNDKVRSSNIYRENLKRQVIRQFEKSRFVSESYPGPNFEGICNQEYYEELFKHYNKRAILILNEYAKAFLPAELRTYETHLETEGEHIILKSQDREFCEDMMNNIQHWPRWVIEGTYLAKSRSKENKPKLLAEADKIFNTLDMKHTVSIQTIDT